jgi:hypothetical protein
MQANNKKELQMKVSFRNSLAITLGLIFLHASGLAAGIEDGVIKTKSRTYKQQIKSAPGKTLYIEDTQANLVISGKNQDEIIAEADLMIEIDEMDEEFIDEFLEKSELTLEPYRDGFRLKLKTPRDEISRKGRRSRSFLSRLFDRDDWHISISTKVHITIPSKQSLSIDNKYGDISIVDVEGDLSLENSSGEMMIENCSGTLDVFNSSSPVEIQGFEGPVYC